MVLQSHRLKRRNDLSCDRTDKLVVERQDAIGGHWGAKRNARLSESKDKSHRRELARRAPMPLRKAG